MKKINFIVGKTNTGYDAYREENDKIIAVTTGSTIAELKANALESYNLYQDCTGRKPAIADQITLTFDVPSFFDFYNVINAKALSSRIGMNNTLLSQYVKGIKKPSAKQIHKILNGVKEIGKELSELELA